MILLVRFFLAFVFSQSVFAQKHTTGDWDRREAFVNPAVLDEKRLQSWEGGRWLEDGLEGSYRFVITEVASGKEKLYVQWLVDNNEIAYSMSIRELNARPQYDIDMPICQNKQCNNISVTAKHVDEKTQTEFTLQLRGLGKYGFSM